MAVHRSLSGVVAREGEIDASVEVIEQPAQIARSAVDVLGGVKDVLHAEPLRRLGHQLEDARGSAR